MKRGRNGIDFNQSERFNPVILPFSIHVLHRKHVIAELGTKLKIPEINF